MTCKDKLNFLVVVDASWKWMKIIPMSSTTSLKIIEPLHSLFACYSISEELVSDNGVQLAAEEFTKFMRQNGVKFTNVPLYHPALNWAAEHSVKTAKLALTKQVFDGKACTLCLEHQLANFLILNRSAPHNVTGQSSAELWQIRNCFTLLQSQI